MNKFTVLQQSFFTHLRNLFGLTTGKSEDEVDEILLNQASNEEEKIVIREICDEVEIEHRLMSNLNESGMDSGEWLEHEIENTLKELYPEATPEEIEMVKDRVQKGMEDEIDTEVDSLEDELSFMQLSTDEKINSKEENESGYE